VDTDNLTTVVREDRGLFLVDANQPKNRLAKNHGKTSEVKNLEIEVVSSNTKQGLPEAGRKSSRNTSRLAEKPHVNDPEMMKKIRKQEKQRIAKLRELRKTTYEFENSAEIEEEKVPVKVELNMLHTDELLGYYKEVLSKGRKDFIAHSKNHGVH